MPATRRRRGGRRRNPARAGAAGPRRKSWCCRRQNSGCRDGTACRPVVTGLRRLVPVRAEHRLSNTQNTAVGHPCHSVTPWARANPIAMPMPPPNRLSTTASTRNCSSTSRPRAPIAIRNPISRVRSVTETSMMFMMPMPPTSSDTPAMPARSEVIVCVACTSDARHLLHGADHEVVGVARLDFVTRAQHRRDAVAAVVAGVGGGCRRHRDLLDEGDAAHLLHHRRVGHEDDIVLVLAHARLSLAGHDAEDGEGQIVDANHLADRIAVGRRVDRGRRCRGPRPSRRWRRRSA